MTARDLFGMESDPVEPGARGQRVNPQLAQRPASSVSRVSYLIKMSYRDDAPTLASVLVVTVDLETGDRIWTVCELGTRCGPKDDRVLADRIVDGEDLRATGHDDRKPAELLTAQVLPTLFCAEREHPRRGKTGTSST